MNLMPIRPRAVIYVRVSDPSQIDNNSLETQERACKNFLKQKGWDLAGDIFREEGVSAKHVSTRPALNNLIYYSTKKENRVSFVVVYKFDRWSRNTQEGLGAEALLSKYGIELYSVMENVSRDPMGTFIKTISLASAQMENEMKGIRVTDNQKTMFRNGYWCWKPPTGYRRPYGIKSDRKGKECLIDENIGPMIKFLFEEASKIHISKMELARRLNSMGFAKFYGKEADCNLISKIIPKTFYHGYMYSPKWKEYSIGKHQPLIDEETWRKANINLFGNKAKYNFKDTNTYPIKGLVICSCCHKPMTTTGPTGNGKVFYYECKNKKCEHQQRIIVDKAHDKFLDILEKVKPTESTLKLFTNMVFSEWDRTIDDCQKRTDEIDKNIKDLKESIIDISNSNRKGIFTDEEAKEQADEVRKKIVVCEIERSDVKMEQYDTEIVRNFTEQFLLNLDKLWNRIDLPKKQALQNKIFPNGLVCEKHDIRTNGLSASFQYIETLNNSNSSLVTLRGIEPRLAE